MTATVPPHAPGAADPGDPGGPVGTAAKLATARRLLTEVGSELWAAKAPEELLAVNAELERLRSAVAGVQAPVAVEIDATDAAGTDGWATARDYLTATSGARRGHGGRLLRTGRELCGAREATHAALAAGDISPEHAQVIVAAIAKLPLDPQLRAVAEAWLLEHAQTLIAAELETAAEKLLEVLDPDGTAQRDERALDRLERAAHTNRHLTISDDRHGGVTVRGRGTVEDAAVIKAALSPLSAPEPAGTDGPDGQRADCGTTARDPRDHGTRTWDALVTACQRLADAQVLPTDHGMKPRVIVTLDLDTLRSGIGTGTLDTGDRLSGAAVRRLACDSDLIPGVLGARGEILDVGKAQRLVTAAIWTALVLRDTHCAFPGCRRPPLACDAHHIVHWADGGPTALHNLVLLCRAHHTTLHHTGWQVRPSSVDGRPEFKPPHRRRLVTTAEGTHTVVDGEEWIRDRRPRRP